MSNSGDYEFEVAAAVRQAVNWFGRKFSGDDLHRDDLAQQGWVVALDSMKNFDPDKGSLGGYLYMAIRRSLGNYITKDRCPVTIGGDWEEHRRTLKGVDLKAACTRMATNPTPEEAAFADARFNAAVKWGLHFSECLETILADRTPVERRVFFHRYGLDGGPEQTPREIAKSVDLPVTQVYAILSRLNRAASESLDLYRLNQQLQETAPNGIEEAFSPDTFVDRSA